MERSKAQGNLDQGDACVPHGVQDICGHAIEEAFDLARLAALSSLKQLSDKMSESSASLEAAQRKCQDLENCLAEDRQEMSQLQEKVQALEDGRTALQHSLKEKAVECKKFSEKYQVALGYRRVCTSLQAELQTKEAERQHLAARLEQHLASSSDASNSQRLHKLEQALASNVKEMAGLKAERKEWHKHREILKEAYRKERSKRKDLQKGLDLHSPNSLEPAENLRPRAVDTSQLGGERVPGGGRAPGKAQCNPGHDKLPLQSQSCDHRQRPARQQQPADWLGQCSPGGNMGAAPVQDHDSTPARAHGQGQQNPSLSLLSPESQPACMGADSPSGGVQQPSPAGPEEESSARDQSSDLSMSPPPERPQGGQRVAQGGSTEELPGFEERDVDGVTATPLSSTEQVQAWLQQADCQPQQPASLSSSPKSSQLSGLTKSRSLPPRAADPSSMQPCIQWPNSSRFAAGKQEGSVKGPHARADGGFTPGSNRGAALATGSTGSFMTVSRTDAGTNQAVFKARVEDPKHTALMDGEPAVRSPLFRPGSKKRKSPDLGSSPKVPALGREVLPEGGRVPGCSSGRAGPPLVKQRVYPRLVEGSGSAQRERRRGDASVDSATPGSPMDKEAASAFCSPRSASYAMPCLSGGQAGVDPVAGHARGQVVGTEKPQAKCRVDHSTRGVLETLHILDMSQGLMGSDAAALLPIHEGKRKNCLPTIVEWAPAVKNKPVDVSADCSPHKVQDYKYREVVRKKVEREELRGFGCKDCEGFYRAVQSWGLANCQLPLCGHVTDKGSAGAAGLSMGSSVERMQQQGSRHRYRFEPPSTPEGFWDLGFGDSQDSR